MSSFTPTPEPRPFLTLRHTNVSNPSIVVQHSQQSLRPSLTASEDFYSLSSASSTHSDRVLNNPQNQSTHTITRYLTPPSRYRTPLQSRDQLAHYASQEEMRKTPMRGQGKRRQSPTGLEPRRSSDGGAAGVPPTMANNNGLRDGGMRRKPVPGPVVGSRRQSDGVTRQAARSSAAMEIDREASPPTPGMDDTPYIRFALDQLTRDEEVRGSRQYRGMSAGADTNYPYVVPEPLTAQREVPVQGSHEQASSNWPLQTPPQPPQQESQPTAEQQYNFDQKDRLLPQGIPPSAFWAQQKHAEPHDQSDAPPPRSPRRLTPNTHGEEILPLQDEPRSSRGYYHGPHHQPEQAPEVDTFVPLSASEAHQERLRCTPTILQPLSIGLFLVLILILIALLVLSGVWSLTHDGIWDYLGFGDARYFVFQYLPTLLGIILFLWLVQIMVAVYRLAPFIAVSSNNSVRERGAELPLYPKGFVLPFVGHFRAGLPVIGIFMVVAWLQIFTIPLLASIFNVYHFGDASTGRWKWVATQAIVWVVVVLYVLLFLAVVTLLLWLRGRNTGLRWDPRTLADVLVLLERSNALEGIEIEEEPAQLGYWKTLKRNEVFHTYGVVDKPARMYGVQDGRIQEKTTSPLQNRLSDTEHEDGALRNSSEKMIWRRSSIQTHDRHSRALPWFLRPSMALLWIIIALVLLVAFLVVSYLPSTRVADGFAPAVPAPVNTAGFSSTNLLYSFVPALLGTLCLLFWLNIDYTYRRLAPFTALAHPDGALAEKSLLLSYTADIFPPPTALANKHWRVALLSSTTLIAASLPILAGGVFWAQFYVSTQSIRIAAHMPAYYALTALATCYALSYLAIFPSPRTRSACAALPNPARSFADIIDLVHQSRVLDDWAFHSPRDRIDLVTRLLSAPPGLRAMGLRGGVGSEAAASKASLADSLRGFARARVNAQGGAAVGGGQVSRYYLGRCVGRNGVEGVGIDRLRN